MVFKRHVKNKKHVLHQTYTAYAKLWLHWGRDVCDFNCSICLNFFKVHRTFKCKKKPNIVWSILSFSGYLAYFLSMSSWVMTSVSLSMQLFVCIQDMSVWPHYQQNQNNPSPVFLQIGCSPHRIKIYLWCSRSRPQNIIPAKCPPPTCVNITAIFTDV